MRLESSASRVACVGDASTDPEDPQETHPIHLGFNAWFLGRPEIVYFWGSGGPGTQPQTSTIYRRPKNHVLKTQVQRPDREQMKLGLRALSSGTFLA